MRFKKYYYKVISEGAAYGHIDHPFEDDNLTFGDMKEMIRKALQGDLKMVNEKTDGQNLMFTFKNGKIKFARNKSHIKDFGKNALSINELTDMFFGKGEVSKAFTYAAKDIENVISKLPPEKVKQMFNDGQKFMSIEIIYPKTENVIPYGLSMIVPHSLIQYDEKGNEIEENKESAKELVDIIQQANLDTQENFKFKYPEDIGDLRIVGHDNQLKKFIDDIDTMIENKGLNDENTLSDFKEEYWKEFIKNKLKEYNYDLSDDVIINLVKRWGLDEKSLKISDIKKQIDNKDFLDWVIQFDKTGVKEEQKKSIKPLETLFLKLGVTLLKNMNKFLTLNPDKATQKIKEKINKKIEEIKSSDSKEANKKLNRELERLKSVGGLNSIVPSEGIVFMYNGKMYKFTGVFAPINQILGIGKY